MRRLWRWIAGLASSFDWSPETWYRIHFWAAAVWFGPMSLFCWWVVYQLTDDKLATLLILLVSNYANFVSHWSAWQAVRAERESSGH